MSVFNLFKKRNQVKAGDFVRCIDDRDWNNSAQSLKLVYGKNYKVLMVVRCPDCGAVSYDIGCKFDDNRISTMCKRNHKMPLQGTRLAGDFRFERLIDDEAFTEEDIKKEIEEAVAMENFELAQIYKNRLEQLK